MTRIDLTETYPYPIAQVWAALTDKAAISEWLMTTDDFEPVVGCKFRLRSKPMPGWRGFVDCVVLEATPPARLSYSWVGDEKRPPMTVTWTLTAVAHGTRLQLEHSGFEGFGGFILAKLMMGPGWKKMMRKKLPAVIEVRLQKETA